MKKMQAGLFANRLNRKLPQQFPISGQIELTYRCNLKCIHCYCKGLEDKDKELTTEFWKRILDTLQKQGCLYLCFTGGDPLMRDDFLEIYSYAKEKGFLINLFTNGTMLTSKLIDYLENHPPVYIEITLNGITQKTYESITQIPGSFLKVIKTIHMLKESKLPFILKSNCLKQNKREIVKVKAFTEQLFTGLPRNKYRFKYDVMIYPRLNLDKAPTRYRLPFKELSAVKKQDPDIWKEYQKNLRCRLPVSKRDRSYLYLCNAWQQHFFINPYGYLKFCRLSDKFGVNLRRISFNHGFYRVFPQLLRGKFKTNSKCKDCKLRTICYYCPARAYLETGDEEAPIPYFCELAKGTYREMKKIRVSGKG